MIDLRKIDLNTKTPSERFPFNLPVVSRWTPLSFNRSVSFFVGENGSGKSTLTESIACAVGSITVGTESVRTDPTLAEIRELADLMKLTWNKRTRRGFFLRAEDFFGYIKTLTRIRAEFEEI